MVKLLTFENYKQNLMKLFFDLESVEIECYTEETNSKTTYQIAVPMPDPKSNTL